MEYPAWLLAVAALAPAAKPAAARPADGPPAPDEILRRARAYLRTIPPAVAGQRGHDRTFYAANRLVRGYDLAPDAAFPLLAEWNRACVPPWADQDLYRKLAQAAAQPGPRGFLVHAAPPPPGTRHAPGATFRNFAWGEQQDGETVRRVKVGRRGADLLDELEAYTGGWPRRVGGMLFAPGRGGGVLWMKAPAELFAWLDYQYGLEGGRGFDWAGGGDCLTQQQFFTHCQQNCEAWDQVELYPHEPRLPGHYYLHPEVPADRADGTHLTNLVQRFFPATPFDEDLIRLFFLTLVWGGPLRKRPVFLFEADPAAAHQGRGAGKSTVAQLGSALVGGYFGMSPNEQVRDVQTRLLSPDALTQRVVLIDNLKSLRFSNSDLEGLITTPTISGRQLYTGNGRRPNTLLWAVTSNNPALSKDLAQRSVVVRVTTPVYDPAWERSLLGYVEANRWLIIADCVAELRKPAALPDGYEFDRWSEWEGEVMAKAPDPVGLGAELRARRGQVDADDDVAQDIADAIRDLLRRGHFDPTQDVVLIPSQVLYEEVVKRFNPKVQIDRPSGLRWLYMLGVKELSKHDASLPYRGGVWRPDNQPADTKYLLWTDRFGRRALPD